MNSKNSLTLILTTCVGNLFEHYDTALFSLLAPFLALQFFPNQDPISALILTYAIIPLGMLARPLGSLVFGYMGDVWGRKQALAASLIGMAVMTGLMGMLPTYQQAGFLAPVYLSLGRVLQNFFGAGEIVGGAICLIENTPAKHKHFMSGVYGSSTIAGILLASLGISILNAFDAIENGWRILYGIGFLTASFGFILRYQIGCSDIEPKQESWRNILKEFWKHRKIIVLIAWAAGFGYATYSIAFVFINGFIPLISNVTPTQTIHMNTALLVIDLLTLPLFGLLANRFSCEKLMLSASLTAALIAVPLFLLASQASFWPIFLIRLCLVLIGVWFTATFYSWSQHIVPRSIRYSLISFAYALGTQLLGSPTSTISLWLYQSTHIVTSVCWYWAGLGAFFTLMLAQRLRSNNSYECAKT